VVRAFIPSREGPRECVKRGCLPRKTTFPEFKKEEEASIVTSREGGGDLPQKKGGGTWIESLGRDVSGTNKKVVVPLTRDTIYRGKTENSNGGKSRS